MDLIDSLARLTFNALKGYRTESADAAGDACGTDARSARPAAPGTAAPVSAGRAPLRADLDLVYRVEAIEVEGTHG
ncbi:hypothetical protein, partial [Nonomuraea wenchangensis]|uniref:hypothetical protein n=1 Tax=Nonomuraea wenchangensis TaxID=568860 RepID=UPI003329FD66